MVKVRRISGMTKQQRYTAPNGVKQQFSAIAPDQIWIADITYIRPHEGWLYLAVVVDLYSRMLIGWSMKPTLVRELAIPANRSFRHPLRPRRAVRQ